MAEKEIEAAGAWVQAMIFQGLILTTHLSHPRLLKLHSIQRHHQSSMKEPAEGSSDSSHTIPHIAHPEKLIVSLVWSLSSRLDEAKTFHDNRTISKRVTLSLQKRKSEVKWKSQFGFLCSPLRLQWFPFLLSYAGPSLTLISIMSPNSISPRPGKHQPVTDFAVD